MNNREIKLEAKEILMNCKKELFIATVITMFLPTLVTILLGFVPFNGVLIGIVSLVFYIYFRALNFSLTKLYIQKRNGKEVGTFDFIMEAFNNVKKSWSVTFGVLVKCIVPIIFMIVAVILMAFGIAMFASASLTGPLGVGNGGDLTVLVLLLTLVFYVLAIVLSVPLLYKYRYVDLEAIKDPESNVWQNIRTTEAVMEGNKFNSFKLDLTYILIAFAAGIVLGFIGNFVPDIIEVVLEVCLISWIQVELLMAHIIFYEDKKGGNNKFNVQDETKEIL